MSALTSFLRMPAAAGTAIAVEFAVVHNLIWHERFTWRSPRATAREVWRRACRFHAANSLVSIAGNTTLM